MSEPIRKIAILTGSRADYGLLYHLISACHQDELIDLQLIVTGMHLSPTCGYTISQIKKDGFPIAETLEMLLDSDSEVGVAKSIGLGIVGFADVFRRLDPDIIVLLGDRFEILAAATAASMGRRFLAHIHGGESTEGAIDESIRHSVTKMSHFHFPSTQAYAGRIARMGENPAHIFVFGAPGLDYVYRADRLSSEALSQDFGVPVNHNTALVTFHPATLDGEGDVGPLLRAISQTNLNCIFTGSNADMHGRSINQAIQEFVKQSGDRHRFVITLGSQRYLSCLSHIGLIIGNSSSGLIEAPTFGLPVVNIGDRQRGRIRGENVIDAELSEASILDAIQTARDPEFRQKAAAASNPYNPLNLTDISWRIKEVLKALPLSVEVLKKRFFD